MERHTSRDHLLRAFAAAGLFLVVAALSAWRPGERTEPPGPRGAPPPEADEIDRTIGTSTVDSLERLGHLGEAVALARSVSERLAGAGAPVRDRIEAWTRLGQLQVEQGENLEAVGVLSRALRSCEGDPGVSNAQHASVLVALAKAEKNRGLYTVSERHYDEALRLARTAGEAGTIVEARALSGQAHLIRRSPADRERAAWLLRDALRVASSAREADAREIAEIQSGLALVLLQLGQAARAESLLSLAAPAMLARLGPDHPEVGLIHSLWGWSQYRQGRYAAAEASFRRAMEAYDRARPHFTAGANRRRLLQRVAVNLAGSLLAQGRGDEAFAALEDGLSSYLADRLDERPVPGAGAPWRRATAAPPLDRRSLQRYLDPSTAIVGWVEVNLVNEAPTDSWGFVLRHEGPVRWAKLTNDGAAGGPSAHLYDLLLRDSRWPARVLDHEGEDSAGREAWDARMAPLEPFLKGVDHLVVVNAWGSTTVPIEAFVGRNGRLLLERYDVAYAPSARVYAALRERSRHQERRREASALLVGDGAYGGESSFHRRLPALPGVEREIAWVGDALSAARVDTDREVAAENVRGMAASGRLGAFDLLHFATHAAYDVRLPGFAALVVDGDAQDPSPAGMRPRGASRFAEARLPDDVDGLLTAAEIERWRLNARLVTLSGCQTSGVQFFGTAPGLAESFLVAGAGGVVVSLWKVDDRATSLLMARLYQELASQAPAASRPARNAIESSDVPRALQAAKRWLRGFQDRSGRRPFRNPAYWAGFVYIGARS